MNAMRKVLAVLVALAVAFPVGATSVTGVKVTRIRRGTANDVFVQVSVPPATLDCVGGGLLVAQETYVFDGDTSAGRVLDALLLAAYSGNKFVDIVGAGTCRTFGAGLTQVRFENVSSATIR